LEKPSVIDHSFIHSLFILTFIIFKRLHNYVFLSCRNKFGSFEYSPDRTPYDPTNPYRKLVPSSVSLSTSLSPSSASKPRRTKNWKPTTSPRQRGADALPAGSDTDTSGDEVQPSAPAAEDEEELGGSGSKGGVGADKRPSRANKTASAVKQKYSGRPIGSTPRRLHPVVLRPGGGRGVHMNRRVITKDSVSSEMGEEDPSSECLTPTDSAPPVSDSGVNIGGGDEPSCTEGVVCEPLGGGEGGIEDREGGEGNGGTKEIDVGLPSVKDKLDAEEMGVGSSKLTNEDVSSKKVGGDSDVPSKEVRGDSGVLSEKVGGASESCDKLTNKIAATNVDVEAAAVRQVEGERVVDVQSAPDVNSTVDRNPSMVSVSPRKATNARILTKSETRRKPFARMKRAVVHVEDISRHASSVISSSTSCSTSSSSSTSSSTLSSTSCSKPYIYETVDRDISFNVRKFQSVAGTLPVSISLHASDFLSVPDSIPTPTTPTSLSDPHPNPHLPATVVDHVPILEPFSLPEPILVPVSVAVSDHIPSPTFSPPTCSQALYPHISSNDSASQDASSLLVHTESLVHPATSSSISPVHDQLSGAVATPSTRVEGVPQSVVPTATEHHAPTTVTDHISCATATDDIDSTWTLAPGESTAFFSLPPTTLSSPTADTEVNDLSRGPLVENTSVVFDPLMFDHSTLDKVSNIVSSNTDAAQEAVMAGEVLVTDTATQEVVSDVGEVSNTVSAQGVVTEGEATTRFSTQGVVTEGEATARFSETIMVQIPQASTQPVRLKARNLGVFEVEDESDFLTDDIAVSPRTNILELDVGNVPAFDIGKVPALDVNKVPVAAVVVGGANKDKELESAMDIDEVETSSSSDPAVSCPNSAVFRDVPKSSQRVAQCVVEPDFSSTCETNVNKRNINDYFGLNTEAFERVVVRAAFSVGGTSMIPEERGSVVVEGASSGESAMTPERREIKKRLSSACGSGGLDDVNTLPICETSSVMDEPPTAVVFTAEVSVRVTSDNSVKALTSADGLLEDLDQLQSIAVSVSVGNHELGGGDVEGRSGSASPLIVINDEEEREEDGDDREGRVSPTGSVDPSSVHTGSEVEVQDTVSLRQPIAITDTSGVLSFGPITAEERTCQPMTVAEPVASTESTFAIGSVVTLDWSSLSSVPSDLSGVTKVTPLSQHAEGRGVTTVVHDAARQNGEVPGERGEGVGGSGEGVEQLSSNGASVTGVSAPPCMTSTEEMDVDMAPLIGSPSVTESIEEAEPHTMSTEGEEPQTLSTEGEEPQHTLSTEGEEPQTLSTEGVEPQQDQFQFNVAGFDFTKYTEKVTI